MDAPTYIGDTALLAPPFFENVVRRDLTTWGSKVPGPRVINWTGLGCQDQAAILRILRNTNSWILLALVGKTKSGTLPLPGPLEGSVIAITTQGKAFRKRKWWILGDDKLAEYDRKVEA